MASRPRKAPKLSLFGSLCVSAEGRSGMCENEASFLCVQYIPMVKQHNLAAIYIWRYKDLTPLLFSLVYSVRGDTGQLIWVGAESIERFIEDQAFSPLCDLAPPPTLFPLLMSVSWTGDTQED
jgi:hypothetical protein